MSRFRKPFEDVRNRIGSYLREPTYACAVALVVGYDLACAGGVLAGFREWLIARLGRGNTLSWDALVLEVAFDGSKDAQQAVRASAATEKQAIDVLFDLIAELDEVRSAPDGLRRIYANYERWLRTQEWFDPSSGLE
jgi:hypothetical protein